MLDEGRMLTHQQARAFYDRLGAKQDWQAFYELLATNNLSAHAGFDQTQSVFEFGCGTGAFAECLLSSHLPPHATAMREAHLILATVAQRYRLRLGTDVRVEPEPLVTLRPRGGLLMTLTRKCSD